MSETTGTQTSGKELVLGQNNYGKSEVRVFKVDRDTERHEIWDLDVRVALEGDFEAVYLKGHNTGALATDTMRNTCYALAKDHLRGSIEDFGLKLVDHFLEAGPTVASSSSSGRVRGTARMRGPSPSKTEASYPAGGRSRDW